MTEHGEQLDKLDRFIGRLRAQQADAQPDGGQAILFGTGKARVKRVDQCRNLPRPMPPMGGIDSEVCIARAVPRKALGKAPRQRRELLGRPHQPANKVEKLEKRGQSTAEIQ
jgi:hypothetical protein